ncbi:MAG TPA: DUF503 domain-containing protein [Candidatus Fraserbacteria bacterium]|nr:DUF503 domain-containing protein [Candidatus Fraserbacteria bacterium]
MRVGILLVRLRLQYPDSLKEKRQIIKSLLAQARRQFNISIAEIDQLDQVRAATLGAAIVSNDGRVNNRVLSKLINQLERHPRVLLEEQHLELL